MFDVGCWEVVLIIVIAIILYGGELPSTIKKIGRTYGKFRGELDKMKNELEKQINLSEVENNPYEPVEQQPIVETPKDEKKPEQPASGSGEPERKTPT